MTSSHTPAMMRAANLHAVGDLRCDSVPIPSPGVDEALVSIEAAGMCGSDLARVYSKGTYNFPTVLGHEFSGTVVECPADPERVGQRVAVFPLIPCRDCPMCNIAEFASCENYDYYGSRRDGGFAQFQAIKLWNLIAVPDQMSPIDAAMVEPCAVAVHALAAAPLRMGDWLAVWGGGPIGMMAAELGRSRGCQVIILDLDQKKLDFAQEKMGIDHALNPSKCDAQAEIMKLTAGRGADVCLEAAGVSATLANCIGSAKPFGHVVLMGNPASAMTLTQDDYWRILRKQLTCVGVWNSARNPRQDDWRTAIGAIEDGLVTPSKLVTHRFALSQCVEAFATASSPDQMTLKVMFIPEEEL